jgi:hypothetical protein
MEPRILVLFSFVIITFLTALAVLAAAIGLLPQASDKLVSWGIPAVLGEIVLTVIMYFRAGLKQQIRINVSFDGQEPADVNLDDATCTYKIKDLDGKQIKKGSLGATFGHGGWQVQLPTYVSTDQSVALSFQFKSGDIWEVRTFKPLLLTQKAVKTN